MNDRRIDNTRVRNYDDLIHLLWQQTTRPYACGAPYDVHDYALHGVFMDEATTCLWCAIDARAYR